MSVQEICRVAENTQLGDGLFLMVLHAPKITELAQCGQFVHIACGEGHLLRRPISICAWKAPELRIVFQVKGEGTKWLSERRTGDELDVLGPLGHGFDVGALGSAPVFIGGGIGVPPMLGCVREAVKQGAKPAAILGFRNQGAVIVVTCWILAIMICALPFLLSGNYTFTQAVFETTSAWSTTGLSVVDVEHTSHLFLMHRSTILFFGGIGLVLVMLSVLSDTYGMRLYAAEGHNDHLLPNLLKSARIILTMYLCYILSGVALYCLFGMPLFDALIHSIGALSTGGFSSHAQSIGYYDNIWIEMITIVLMLLGNINFLAHLFLIRGKLRNFFQYCEILSCDCTGCTGFGIPVMRGYGDRPAACAANCIVSSRIRINDNRLSNGGHVCDAALRSSAFIDCTAADRWRHRINCRRNQAVSHLCAMQGHLVEYRKSTALRKCDSFP